MSSNEGDIMHSKQRGVTLIGWLFLLIPIAILGYAALRLAPVYLNYMKVSRSMNQLVSEMHSLDTSSAADHPHFAREAPRRGERGLSGHQGF
jgi:Tfp pilus assembly protein PilE